MKKFFQTLEGVGVHHNQPVKYLSPDEIYFHWDPQDTWYPETLNVLLNWEKRTKKRRIWLRIISNRNKYSKRLKSTNRKKYEAK
mgnify:CR=1 FL=1